ncbi:MAG TPA: glycoside hydrolase family 43 protein [Allosphingosinicella sp.]|nr:glycoside hydrolase family 43 protein [Allosphingosinicella sp.]
MPLASSLRLTVIAALAAALAGAAWAKPAFVPVYKTDFPDPFVIEHGGEFLAYSTNSGGINLPMASSSNLVDWRPVMDPAAPSKALDGMPALAPWVKEGRTWAPEVMKIGEQWVLYYTAHHRKNDLQCIGVATASAPRGPFSDTSAQPLVCQEEIGGTIDANPFRDNDGSLYLTFKNDGNRLGKPTRIWSQRLAPDGLSMVGEPVALLVNDRPWEAHVIEASSMVRTPDGITLFYSANHYGWETHQRLSPYSMGYAMCRTPLGPCTDAPENPILYSYNDREAGCLSGPGHQAVFRARGGTFLAFHAWAATSGCRKADNKRYLYIAPLGWENGKPVIAPSLRPAGD